MSFRKRHLYPMLTTSALLAGWVSLGMFWAHDISAKVRKGDMAEHLEQKLQSTELANSRLKANQVDPSQVQLPADVAALVLRPLPASFSLLDESVIVVGAELEAGNQGIVGMQHVIAVMLNRINAGMARDAIDAFTQPGQFESLKLVPTLQGKSQAAIIKLASEPRFERARLALKGMIKGKKYIDRTTGAKFFANMEIVRARAASGDLRSKKALDYFNNKMRKVKTEKDHDFFVSKG